MRSRAFSPLAAILSILLLAATPVHAGPVSINQVVQLVSNYHSSPEIRLRSANQQGTNLRPTTRSLSSGSLIRQSLGDTSTANIVKTSGSLLAGIALGNPDQQEAVNVVAQGDLEGVICDCGEFSLPGFPKWPLIVLAAIPFFFWPDCHDCDPPCIECSDSTLTPTPTPTPPPPIPEPATLLLFGTGLAAFGTGLRRRYAKARAAAENAKTEEG